MHFSSNFNLTKHKHLIKIKILWMLKCSTLSIYTYFNKDYKQYQSTDPVVEKLPVMKFLCGNVYNVFTTVLTLFRDFNITSLISNVSCFGLHLKLLCKGISPMQWFHFLWILSLSMTSFFILANSLIKGTFGTSVFWLVELLGVESKEKKSYTEYFICLLN